MSVFSYAPIAFKLSDEPANLLVHAIHHRRMNRHLRSLKTSLLVAHFAPWQRTVHFARPKLLHRIRECVRWPDLPLQCGERGINESHLPLSVEPSFTHRVPAREIVVAILGNIRWQGVQRKMRSDERKIVEERLVGVICRVVLQA